MTDVSPSAITVQLKTFCTPEVSDLPEGQARKLIAAGEIKSIRIGRFRYVILDTYRNYVARQLEQNTRRRRRSTPDSGDNRSREVSP